MVQQVRKKTLADTTDVDASTTYSIDFEWAASAAVHATWTKTSVTGSIVLQKSCDGNRWTDVGSSADLSAVTTYFAEVDNKGYHYLQLAVTISGGKLDTLLAVSNIKG
jgi:hypothetical protein